MLILFYFQHLLVVLIYIFDNKPHVYLFKVFFFRLPSSNHETLQLILIISHTLFSNFRGIISNIRYISLFQIAVFENTLNNFSDKHWYTSFSTPYFFLFTYIHAQRHYNIPFLFKPVQTLLLELFDAENSIGWNAHVTKSLLSDFPRCWNLIGWSLWSLETWLVEFSDA